MDREKPKQGEFYRHFKGKMYQIVAVALHSETDEELVIYQKLYDDFKIYARPLYMFMSEVDRKKYPEASQKYRFEKVVFEEIKEQITENSMAGIQEKPVVEKVAEEADNNPDINPDLLQFLNADTYEEKRNVLVSFRHRITDRLIDDIAMSMDVTVEKGEPEDRYQSLLSCVDTMAKFEVTRF